MMKLTTNKSANQLIMKKDRSLSDYLKLFNTRNLYEENTEIYNNVNNERYKRLYNLNKIKQEREEDYRQKMLKLRELNELSECSFVPKVNKDFEYKKDNIFNNINTNNSNNNKYLFTDKSSSFGNKGKSEEMTDILISDLLKRQDEWIKKKNKKMELNKQLENDKVKENLVFTPEINKNNLDYMKIDAQEIVADPESYKDYIDRNKKVQKNMEIINNIKIRNSCNNKYDYTEHKLIYKNSYSKNNRYKESKSVDMKKQIKGKNIVYNKSKINNINNDDIYSMIYNENKEKYENRKNYGFNEEERKNIFNGKTQLEFREALDILHQKLINLDIYDDSDDEKS